MHNPTGLGEVVIDNPAATTTGTWLSSGFTSGGRFLGTNFLYRDGGAGTVTWTPTLPAASRWRVYARWSSWSDWTPAVDYVVHHADGSTPVTVDQRYNGGRWNSLGEFDMAPGQNHRVALDALAAERTTADAVRFVPVVGARVVQADALKIVPNTAEDALYVHTDQLGTPRKLSDPTGAVVWDASLTPYGLEDSIAGTETLDSRFPGQWADAETNLNYNYFRDYDPTLGRYIQSDPIGLRGGLNTFGYVGGNPVNYTDPKGLIMLPPGTVDDISQFFKDLFSFPRVCRPGPGGLPGLPNVLLNEGNEGGGRSIDNPPSLEGATPEEVEAAAEEARFTDRIAPPRNDPSGARLRKPGNDADQVRIQSGNPGDSNPIKRGPYVRVTNNHGKDQSGPIPLAGNPTLK